MKKEHRCLKWVHLQPIHWRRRSWARRRSQSGIYDRGAGIICARSRLYQSRRLQVVSVGSECFSYCKQISKQISTKTHFTSRFVSLWRNLRLKMSMLPRQQSCSFIFRHVTKSDVYFGCNFSHDRHTCELWTTRTCTLNSNNIRQKTSTIVARIRYRS